MSEHERKLANLILGEFANVSSAGTASGRRGKLLAKLIVEKGESVSSEPVTETDETQAAKNEVVRLKKLTVQNFRGFSDPQTFEFLNPYTFVYGPNGTGKSSLCEALEYALLGSIHEAESKRIPVADYIRNAVTRKSGMPILHADTPQALDIALQPDLRRFEFCFIEKNRIDGFARVAANTASAQQARLAALFGLDEFNTFATQFNETIDTYLDCVGKKAKELTDKAKTIAGFKAILEGIPEKRKSAEIRGTALCANYSECKTIDEVKTLLVGTDGNGGRQKANNTEIGRLQNLKSVPDPGIDGILPAVSKLLALISEKRNAEKLLNEYKDQLSLRDLYAAVLKNRDKFENTCPACSSELYKSGELAVPVDPYEFAHEKLKQFDAALQAEARIAEIRDTLNEGWKVLQNTLPKLLSTAAAVDFPSIAEVQTINAQGEASKGAVAVESFLQLLSGAAELLSRLKTATNTFNEAVGKSKSGIKTLEDANLRIAKDLEEIVAISTLSATNKKSEDEANVAITKFNQENEVLIKEVEAEKPIIARNQAFSTAYISFRKKLIEYNASLPLSLAADLNEKTLKFYNEINKYDHPSDKLRSLALPTATGQRIEIEYESGETCDALQILSEGHIRCLGLAILLAKITRDDLPFLIFDDVVNSIDDEHRGAIIDLILNPDEVGKRQLIVTTHGEDFVKRLENAIPFKQYKETVTRIDFLRPFASKKITVKLDSPRNYLTVAVRSFEEGKIRDSLSYVRKSFEELLNRLWRKISNKKLTAQLSVGMRGPGSPDLMSLATGLSGFLSKKDVTVFQDALPHLHQILGEGVKHNIEWTYLNKGTHEEDQTQEFDASVVRRMLDAVIKLDEAIEGN